MFSDFFASPAGSEVTGQLTNFFSGVLSTTLERNGLVKQGPQPTGNLSQAQLQQGYVAGNPTLNQNNPNAGGLMNSIGFTRADGSMNLAMVGGAFGLMGLLAYLVLKK